MNGCQGDPRAPIGTIETRTLPAVSSPALAMERLNSAISDLVKSEPPPYSSGIIRLEIEALEWLHAQNHLLLPRCFFSGRRPPTEIMCINGTSSHSKLVSVAGVGSAVFFTHLRPFSFDDWRAIRRFLSKKCPLIRAYGAIRFDATANIASEWSAFGSFYFMVPQVEFDELEGSSIIAATIAWDNAASWTYQRAIDELRATIWQLSSILMTVQKKIPHSHILARTHVPGKSSWDHAVKRALQIISRNDSVLIKVVLARSTRVVTAADIDPLTWLACLKVEGENAYQFCLQPPHSPAFIGNTPEQLFHRDRLSICSEALAGTRARGGSELLDVKIEQDLLSSAKDHNEFAIVRECIRRRLEAVCSSVLIEPKKAIRKFSRVQHLYARLRGRLQAEDDESSGGSKQPRDEPSENVHNEESPRRSTRQRTSTSFGSDFVTFLLENKSQSFREAMSSSDLSFWKAAVNSEIDSILSNHTWELVDLPPGNKPLGSKWIFKRKMKADVTRITSIRMLIALAVVYDLQIHQMDVKTAFLNGDLEEEIYMEQPEGFVVPEKENKVCKLVKSLYGLKQAPKQWHAKFDQTMLTNGFKINECDKCVYIKDTPNHQVIVCLYVDDMLIISRDICDINATKRMLESKFDMKDLGVADVILGIRIHRTPQGLALSQSHYIEKVLDKFKYMEFGIAKTPLDVNFAL
ncbi:Isochorismate synthase, chloroplastic [Capsicum annuum]|uniref:Isochorismate synthase, chloroplastic n=1 Tax=Capsicum annuum TaxID=4072 RepID=A0A2G2ZCE7_CAPAN|nr:Isochorismate synthase, chloroplastic [Capsicum annuum]